MANLRAANHPTSPRMPSAPATSTTAQGLIHEDTISTILALRHSQNDNGMKLSKAKQGHFSSISPTAQEVLRGMMEAQIPLTSPLPEPIQALGSCQKDLSPDTQSILGTAAQTLTTYLLERTISECGHHLRATYNTDTDSFGPSYLGRMCCGASWPNELM